MDIVIDFDGTCALHGYPKETEPKLERNAERVLKLLVENGHNLILSTMRSDGDVSLKVFGTPYGLTDAIGWFKDREIPLYGIQTHPTQNTWTTSPKAYGKLIIDDTGIGCPLMTIRGKKVVDWYGVEKLLKERGIL